MTTISNLTAAESIALVDMLPIHSVDASDTLRATMAQVVALVQANIVFPGVVYAVQAEVPTGSGFSITVQPGKSLLTIRGAVTLAAGTVVMPGSPVNGQVAAVSSLAAVTALTVNGNGKALSGAPTTLPAGGWFSMAYSDFDATWYRVA